jgi:hypothetical protein
VLGVLISNPDPSYKKFGSELSLDNINQHEPWNWRAEPQEQEEQDKTILSNMQE